MVKLEVSRVMALLAGVMSAAVCVSCSPSDGSAATSTSGHAKATPAVVTPAEETQPATTAVPCDNDHLKARATKLWAGKQADDCQTVFEFEILTEETKNATVEEFCSWYEQDEPFIINDFEIKEAIVDSSCDYGWVNMTSLASMRKFSNVPARELQRWEKWVVHDGAWKPVPRPQLTSFPEAPVMRDAAEESILRTRYEQAWDAKVASDWPALVELTDPQDRHMTSIEQLDEAYIIYISHDVAWVQVIGVQGIVRDAVTHKINDPSLKKLPPGVAYLSEKWVKYQGEWFIDLDPSN